MSKLPDLVLDSRLHTSFEGSKTIHSYLDIDHNGNRFSRKEHWQFKRSLGHGGFGQVMLQRRMAEGSKHHSLRAVKIINKPRDSSESLNCNRELEVIAKFSNDRVSRKQGYGIELTITAVQTLVCEIVWLV